MQNFLIAANVTILILYSFHKSTNIILYFKIKITKNFEFYVFSLILVSLDDYWDTNQLELFLAKEPDVEYERTLKF